ncbi:hypothetical protein VNI00_014303 [Paramarasmius palmivorus]|uniref:Uncharacterized protein n=1 Tax=Paramarasmius palmivorus TaxID=297713 RepID=A0AAW0BTY0_9AGAR
MSAIKAPDGEFVKVYDQVLRWYATHPSMHFSAAVEGLYLGVTCPEFQSVLVPLWDYDKSHLWGHWTVPAEYRPRIEDVVYCWFQTLKNVDPVRVDILDRKVARERDTQYAMFLYPQVLPCIMPEFDTNRRYGEYANGERKAYGPLLLVKYKPSTKAPVDIDISPADPEFGDLITKFIAIMKHKEDTTPKYDDDNAGPSTAHT